MGGWTMTGMYAHQYTKEPGSAFYGPHGTVPGDPNASLLFRTVDFFALNNIFVPTPSTAIAVRYGYNRFKDFGGNYPEFDAATLGFPSDLVNAMTFNTFPTVNITGYNGLGNGGPNRTTHVTQTANASISYLKRSHTLKFGGEYRRIGADVRSFSSSAGTYSFTQSFTALTPTASGGDAFASFLLGSPASGSIVYATPAEYLVDYYAAYAQDEWRVSPTLTVNYGLRYEYEPGVREANNQFTVGFDRDADFPVQVPGLALKGGLMYAGENGYPTRQGEALNGVAPRGGFAWSLSNRDVIRGGYGFFWAPMQFSGVGETAMGRMGYTATTTYLASTDGNRTPANSLSDPFPSGILTPQGSSKGLATGAGGVIDFVDQSSKPGRVHQYSVDYTRELPGSTAVSIGYSGSRSEQMPVGGTVDTTVNINQIDPSYLSLGPALLDLVPNPFFGNAAFGNLASSATIARGQLLRPFPQFTDVLAHRVTEARTRYNAMTLRFDRRIRNNWGVNANYTFSRLMDNQFGESNTYSNAQYDRARQLRPGSRVGIFAARRAPSRECERHLHRSGGRRAQAAHRWTRQRDPRRLVGHDGGALPERLSRQRVAVEQQLGTARQLSAPQRRARRGHGHERIARRSTDQLDQSRRVHSGTSLYVRQRAADAAGSADAGTTQRRSQHPEVTARLGREHLGESRRVEPLRQPALHHAPIAAWDADIRTADRGRRVRAFGPVPGSSGMVNRSSHVTFMEAS